ncbi:MAG: 4-(cytidine 5'-diphospho)-2-C-methyl-D-erythritol kinase [Verrucomicrobia bacterium]|jgi:4-diphosphocytidyl-2-C-methyl-D-erythritol kinase|nr:4-(cytidine 5'-diphospho)-2-C-methyl-D-erythritol kinase [Verrucomicrobiota bacterium]
MTIELNSPCKVNLLLNILGRRADGFHELETVIQPLPLHDGLRFQRGGSGIALTCSEPALPVDGSNLVHRAASAFREAARVRDGVRIRLDKRLPMAAGLGGGSANAAVTLLGLNQLFGHPLSGVQLNDLAATLGSDVPFFLQRGPALGTGRGERIQPLEPFESLRGCAVLLVRPRFGISTPWAYGQLAEHPESLKGRPGRATDLIQRLRSGGLSATGSAFFNSFEAPVFHKYPVLAVLKEALLEHGAAAALMSGSGSTTFALAGSLASAESLREMVLARLGATNWTAIAVL